MEDRNQCPVPHANESPTVYADRVGRWYVASVSEAHKKQLGQYLTPVAVARFMAKLCHRAGPAAVCVLDPGAGAGVLSCAVCEFLAGRRAGPRQLDLTGYEIDAGLASCLVTSLSYAKEWLRARGVALTFSVEVEDFVMAQADSLGHSAGLFQVGGDGATGFDIAISNPPYFKVPKSDPRAQAATDVVHGQPNIYALFMAVSASLLRPGGRFVFITPRSYAAGPYFRRFRERFLGFMRPDAIHLFGSRRDAFSRDDVLQENVILAAERVDGWRRERGRHLVRISTSIGPSDLDDSSARDVPLAEILDPASKENVLRIPVGGEDEEIIRIVSSWADRLGSYGLQISTGPVVPFRAVRFLSKSGNVGSTHAPLLWMQNVAAMRVDWPTQARGKPQYIGVSPASMPLLVPNGNYVLLRRFSAKEQPMRLTAAPLLAGELPSSFIGLENHLNYIHRPGGSLTEEEAYGLAVLFNSTLLDTYFRLCNGNTQVSATELRAMPLPKRDLVLAMGRRARAASHAPSGDAADAIVEDILNLQWPTLRANEVAHV